MKPTKHTKGLAMVEFTIILPLLLFLLLSILELGRAFYLYTELEKLSRDSTRFLVNEVATGSTGEVDLDEAEKNLLTNKTKNLAVYGDIDGGSIPLLPLLDTKQVFVTFNSNEVQVDIIYTFHPVLSQLPNFFAREAISLNFDMTASYNMRVR